MKLESVKTAAWAVGRAFLVIPLAGFAGGAAVWAARPDLWLVEHVEFVGAAHATSAELRHLADVPNGTTVWGVRPGAVARAVERHPWVVRADVAFAWPDTLRVTVEEHVPVAVLHTPEGLVYVDASGEPFLPARVDELDFPHLVGFGADLGELHPDLARVARRHALALIDGLDARQLVPRARVSEVSFDRTTGFVVVTDRARLGFGPHELEPQLDRLGALLADGVSLDLPVFVDLAPASVAIVSPLGSEPPHPPTQPPTVLVGGPLSGGRPDPQGMTALAPLVAVHGG
ncbi:MAG: FtsQ-type POTRA domain-containing protein [Myxococcota bacterium]